MVGKSGLLLESTWMVYEAENWLHQLHEYLRRHNSPLTLSKTHHKYIFDRFEKSENVDFSVHADRNGY